MKRSYLLLSGLIISSSALFAQNVNLDALQYKGDVIDQSIETPHKAFKGSDLTKAFGDTVFLETFDNSLNGWTVGNNTGSSNNWQWHNDAPGGNYTNEPMIASTSGPGFLSLRMDYINTPEPPTGPHKFDAYVTSPKITIPAMGSVYIQFEQYFRYCCAGGDSLVLEVSTDGVDFSKHRYDIRGGLDANIGTDNPQLTQINVSDALANETEVYIRFHAFEPTHYFWMIDDVAIIEGPENGLELDHFFVGYHSNDYLYSPNYRRIPMEQVSGATFAIRAKNVGSNPTTNVEGIVEASHDSTLTGSAGTGLVYSTDSLLAATLMSLEDTTGSVGDHMPFTPSEKGYYSYIFSVSSDSANQLPASETTKKLPFIVTDSTYALDDGSFSGIGGPGRYVVGGFDGDKVAQMFIIEEETWARSISLAFQSRAEVHGLKVIPFIYSFEEDSLINGQGTELDNFRAGISSSPIYTEFFPITIDTATMGGRWTSFPFTSPVKLSPGAYFVGIEQSEGQSSGKKIMLFRSTTSQRYAGPLSTIMHLINSGGPSPGWYSYSEIDAIRLNVGPENVSVGLEKQANSNTQFEVSPNPTNGDFKMYLDSQGQVDYKLSINNMLGQEIYTEDISVNGKYVKDLSLTGLDKGVYFVKLTNGEESLVKKIVLD